MSGRSVPARIDTFALVAPEGWTAAELSDSAPEIAKALAARKSAAGVVRAEVVGTVVRELPVLQVSLVIYAREDEK